MIIACIASCLCFHQAPARLPREEILQTRGADGTIAKASSAEAWLLRRV